MRTRLALVLTLLLASPALAEDATPPRPDTSSDFWREVRSPGRRRAHTLLRHGLDRLAEARETYGMSHRAALVEGGITRLRLAHHHAPDDPEILYFLALSLAQFDEQLRDGTLRRRDAEAIECFERLRALDPSYEADRVAFELGVLYTRTHALPRAIEEYERAIETSLSDEETITAHANLAEVTMLDGDVESAVAHYERAIELARAAGPLAQSSLLLALFGDAVALDRLGEAGPALERAAEALRLGGMRMDVLHEDGVFFEPRYEIHHYEGLGHLAEAAAATSREERMGHLAEARRSFARFLEDGGSASPFADAARRRFEETDREVRALQAADGPRRGPRRR